MRVAGRLLALGLAALALAEAAGGAAPANAVVRPDDPESLPLLELGEQLFAGNCVSCHGPGGRGVRVPAPDRGAGGIQGLGPSLLDAGALAADFYLRTGYMPLASPDEQPRRSRVLFTERELDALVAYVAALGAGPPVPEPDPGRGDVADGLQLFTEHCAGCHQVVGEGGYVTGAVAPALDQATPVQIAQAVRIGPYLMPSFPESQISDEELDSIIAYVEAAKDPEDRGGWGIGHLGPVPEGMVTWLLAAVVLVATCLVVDRRLRS